MTRAIASVVMVVIERLVVAVRVLVWSGCVRAGVQPAVGVCVLDAALAVAPAFERFVAQQGLIAHARKLPWPCGHEL